MSDNLVLVTGATGNTGAGVVAGLLALKTRVRALVRNVAKGESLRSQGAEVVIGDLDDPATLRKRIFDGVTTVYCCTWNGPTALDQWKNFHAALNAAGASPRIVRLSAFGVPQSRIIKQLAAAEEDLKNSGLAWTILQPTFFMQNTMMTAQTVKEQAAIYFDWGAGKAGMIDVRDVVDSAIGALAATDGRFDGKSFVLTGPQSIGFTEVAASIGKAIGKDVKYVPVPHEAAKQAMVGMGVPEWIVDGFVELAVGFENNFANTTTDGVKTLAGHAPRSFEQFARDFAGVWQA
ncbi:MAG: NAD(P)H-binding protein [Gemmatimonadales bacterium]